MSRSVPTGTAAWRARDETTCRSASPLPSLASAGFTPTLAGPPGKRTIGSPSSGTRPIDKMRTRSRKIAGSRIMTAQKVKADIQLARWRTDPGPIADGLLPRAARRWRDFGQLSWQIPTAILGQISCRAVSVAFEFLCKRGLCNACVPTHLGTRIEGELQTGLNPIRATTLPIVAAFNFTIRDSAQRRRFSRNVRNGSKVDRYS